MKVESLVSDERGLFEGRSTNFGLEAKRISYFNHFIFWSKDVVGKIDGVHIRLIEYTCSAHGHIMESRMGDANAPCRVSSIMLKCSLKMLFYFKM